MGVLLTCVAVRHHSADDVADVVCALFRYAGHRVHPVLEGVAGGSAGREDVLVGPPTDGWVVVQPHYVIQSDLFAGELSKRLGTLASSVSIFEDVFWTHDLLDRGRVLDRFVNFPDYFPAGEYGPEHRGNPALVAATLGADLSQIEPYFQQVPARRAQSRFRRPPKAHPTDRFDLLDGWVVADLWARLGITWVDPGGFHARIPVESEATEDLRAWLLEQYGAG